MGGGSSNNSAMVAEQKAQAEQARQKELQRSARLQSGQQAIDYLFAGTPEGAQLLDLSGITGNTGRSDLSNGYYVDRTPDNGLGQGYGVYDPQGKLLSSAQDLKDLSTQKVYAGGDPTKRTGGFGDDFYNKFKQANLDYYMPEVGRQFNNAKSDLTYSLARANTLRSSTAGSKLSDLNYQNDVNRAQLAAKADSATGELRSTVAANRQAAVNQLYATEDPTLAANTATSLVRNVELTQPALNPIGELFKPVLAGIGSGMQSYARQQAYAPNPTAPRSAGSNYNN